MIEDPQLEDKVASFFASLSPSSWAYINLLGQDTIKTWTPTITFGTAGDLSVSYSTRVGQAIKIGMLVLSFFRVTTSSFTHTTAAGSFIMTGLPYSMTNISDFRGQGAITVWGGVTKANYTQIGPSLTAGESFLRFTANGSGQAPANLAAGDLPTGGTVTMNGFVLYLSSVSG